VTFAINVSMLPSAMQTAAHTVYLNAWFDWNKGGTFTGSSRCRSGAVPKWAVKNYPVTLDKIAGQPALLVTVPLVGGEQVDELWVRATLTLDHPLKSKLEAQGGGKFSYGETEDYLVHEGTVPPPKKKGKKKKPTPPPPVGKAWCGSQFIDDEGPGAFVWLGADFPGPYQVVPTVPAGANLQVTSSNTVLPGFTIKSTKEEDWPMVPFLEIVTVNVTVTSVDGLSATTPCDIFIFHSFDLQPTKYLIGGNLTHTANVKETFAEDVVKWLLGRGPNPFVPAFGSLQRSHSHAAHSAAAPDGGTSVPPNFRGQVLAVAVKGTVVPTGQPGEPLANPMNPNNQIFSLAHIQVLRPNAADGSVTVISTSGPFQMPVGGDPNQITTVHPFNMCVQPGDIIGFNWEGGFDPTYYPHGVTMQAFSDTQGAVTDVYSKHGGTMNGANFHGTSEQNVELLLQAQIGTGPDASSNCPGGTGPSQHTPPPGSI
jgi:hypothetical protein